MSGIDHYEMPHARADECPHAGVGKACRPCRDRFERAPITPDERAAMRALADAATAGPWEVDGSEVSQHWSRPEPWLTVASNEVACMSYCYGGSARGIERDEDAAFIAAARTAVPRLLDALDTAEAERDEARAASARVREAAARCVADEAAESDLTITRQRDRLRAREEQVRRLRAEVTRLHALVADLRAARPAPVWDEDTVRAEVSGINGRHHFHGTKCLCGFDSHGRARSATEHITSAVLAVVREHLPVRPDPKEK